MINHSEQQDKLAAALHKAQGAMGGAKKDAMNPFFKSTYSDLASVMAAVMAPLNAEGIAVVQGAGYDPATGCAEVTTRLLHSSGQWLQSTLMVPLGKKPDPQALGSAISYGKRYGLQALLAVPSVDDDGESAMMRRAPAVITDDQYLTLSSMMAENGVDEAQAAAKMGLHSLRDLPADQYPRWIAKLEEMN